MAIQLWGWDSTNSVWRKIEVDANGLIKVDMSSINLDDLADVNAPTPSDNDSLTYDDATGLWIPEAAVPAAHAASHQNGGSDEIDLEGLDGEPADLTTHKALETGVHGVGSNYIPQAPAADHILRSFTKGWTDEKLLKGAGVDADPDETELTYDLASQFFLPNYMHRNLSRFIWNLFWSYDAISTAVTGTGSVDQPFYTPSVWSGATSGSTALQRMTGAFGWLTAPGPHYFYGFAHLLYSNYATGFVGMAADDNVVITKNSVANHCGFIFETSATEDTIYASNANGSSQTKTDTGVAIAGLWKHLRIESDATSVYFYVNHVLKATHTTNLNPNAMTWKICVTNNQALDNRVYFNQFIYCY